MTETAILALGGNLGDRQENIESAIREISRLNGVDVINVSPLVESHALTEAGTDETKPNYLNGVIEVETSLAPQQLLNELRNIEQAHGRVREERWGSRTLDIDIITFGSQEIDEETLQVPHPRAHERAFVLVPWALMKPEDQLIGHGSIAHLAEPLNDLVWVYA